MAVKEPLRQQPIVLFPDVVGSAALTGEMDPEQVATLLESTLGAMSTAT